MGSGTDRTCDCPEPYHAVLNIVTAEETTIVDAVSSGELDHNDIDTFLDYATAADHDLDFGLVHLVRIVDTLLEERNM
jgi:hypothetical protein